MESVTPTHYKGRFICMTPPRSASTTTSLRSPVIKAANCHVTWAQAQDMCTADGYSRLCRRDELCAGGRHGSIAVGIKWPSDNWTPVADATNEWVQTGTSYWPLCDKHSEIAGGVHGHPAWGTSTHCHAFRTQVCCAP